MQNRATFRKDYQPYPFRLDETRLAFDLRDGFTTVRADLHFHGEGGALRLAGEGLTLEGVAVDGRELGGNEFAVDDESLTLFDVPRRCVVTVRTRIEPERNKALEGLYKSGGRYCTQCEPEGFRHITYHPDRPDVLSRFTTTITANADAHPVMLSNGNLVREDVRDGRRTVTWEDPFPKPSYLFALVAGDLAALRDTFVTRSGREVALVIYAPANVIGQCDYAMGALKRAMRWDEERFGREYDLDIFMIVAVEDFNFGAMENKGLNIFNTNCVLASPDTATDAGYQRVEAVVAHEYFHNWSGNRVTCRDWFQLSLKEGFTVYRDAEFSADMNARAVRRLEAVEFLRDVQFVEDAGPLAHPVRPDAYEEINNFYTATVYEKGAEVIRMMSVLMGTERFRAGCDLYFERHDGSAVAIEDFAAAMEAASGVDLTQFRRWYEQAGTPTLSVTERRDASGLSLAIEQTCPATPGQPAKAPFHMPLALGLVGAGGVELLEGDSVRVSGDTHVARPNADGTVVAHLKAAQTTLRFDGAPESARVSFLRGFSSPVKVDYPRPAADLAFLAVHDPDGFARCDAAFSLLTGTIADADASDALNADVEAAFNALLDAATQAPDDGEAKALLVGAMRLPRAQYLLNQRPGTDILHWQRRRDALRLGLAKRFEARWLALYEGNATTGPFEPTAPAFARRELKNHALAMYALAATDGAERLEAQFEQADNLTDRAAALQAFLNLPGLAAARRQRLSDAFYTAWADEPLLVDLWLRLQAGSELPGTLAQVQSLERHAAFDPDNPNKVRALIGAFCANVPNFHAEGGAGYDFLRERIIRLDATNPNLAARLATAFAPWRLHNAARGQRMRGALEALEDGERSPNLSEVVGKALADAP